MKLIKIGAIWCSGCLVMNNVISKTLKNYPIDMIEYDIDMDEDEADDFIGRHEVWNGDDFPDYIN